MKKKPTEQMQLISQPIYMHIETVQSSYSLEIMYFLQ